MKVSEAHICQECHEVFMFKPRSRRCPKCGSTKTWDLEDLIPAGKEDE